MSQFQAHPISSAAVEDAIARFEAGDPGVAMRRVDAPRGFPCRLTLEEALPGEHILLFRHRPFDGDHPYAEEGPIFARVKGAPAQLAPGALPAFMAHRKLLSVRWYDAHSAILGAEVIAPDECADALRRAFDDAHTSYAHVRNAGYGCFLFRAERA